MGFYNDLAPKVRIFYYSRAYEVLGLLTVHSCSKEILTIFPNMREGTGEVALLMSRRSPHMRAGRQAQELAFPDISRSSNYSQVSVPHSLRAISIADSRLINTINKPQPTWQPIARSRQRKLIRPLATHLPRTPRLFGINLLISRQHIKHPQY